METLFNTMKAYLLQLFILFSFNPIISGQSDTLYVNKVLEPANKDDYTLILTHEYDSQLNKYKIVIFHKKGHKYMEGFSEQPDAQHFVGEVLQYYSSGEICCRLNYQSHKKGILEFYSKKGYKNYRTNFINDKKNGEVNYFDNNEKVVATGLFVDDVFYEGTKPSWFANLGESPISLFYDYKNGEPVSIRKYYKNGKIACEGTLKSEFRLNKVVYYFENGDSIGECTYGEKNDPINGVDVDYQDDLERGFLGDTKPAILKSINYYSDTFKESQIFFDNKGKRLGECSFKGSEPYNGKYLTESRGRKFNNKENRSWKTLFTLSEWRKHGPATVFDSEWRVIKIDNYADDKLDGEQILFDTLGNEISRGIFRDDKPWQGTLRLEKTLCEYSSGQKNGKCIFYSDRVVNDSPYMEAQYNNDKLEGKALGLYDKTGEIIAEGIYRDNQPFEGVFIEFKHRIILLNKYDNGDKISEIQFHDKSLEKEWRNSNNQLLASSALIPEHEINFLTGKKIKYDINTGKELAIGFYKNNKPFEGSFIEGRNYEEYKNGVLHGKQLIKNNRGAILEIHFYVNGLKNGTSTYFDENENLIASGEFRNDQCFNGDFLTKSGIISYKEGKKHGKFTSIINNTKSEINYQDGKKEGEAIFTYWIFNPIRDTFYYRGIYKNDKPFEGEFFEDKNINRYKNGQLDGLQERYPSKIGFKKKLDVNYKGGQLHGKTTYYLFDTMVEGEYKENKKYKGFFKDETKINEGFVHYQNFEKTTDSLFILFDRHILYRDKKPYEGCDGLNGNSRYSVCYNKGKIEKIFTIDKTTKSPDTIAVTHFFDKNGYALNKQGIKTKQIKYKNQFSKGIETHLDPEGNVTGKIKFKDGIITSGCIETSFDFINARDYTFCLKNGAASYFLKVENCAFYIESGLHEKLDIPYPFLPPNQYFFDLDHLNQTIKFYSAETNELVCTVKKDEGGFIEGININNRSDGSYYVTQYKNRQSVNEGLFSWGEVKPTIQEWLKN